jgi:hypothetical protein
VICGGGRSEGSVWGYDQTGNKIHRAEFSGIVAGLANYIGGVTGSEDRGGWYNFIGAGKGNRIDTTNSYSMNAILSGKDNIITNKNAAMIIGSGITADASYCTFVDALKSEGDVTSFWSSDIKLKDNVRPIEDAVLKIQQIRGVKFEWNDKLGDRAHQPAGTTDYGVIAQDVQKVLPEIVKERKDGFLGLRYERMIPLLLQGIKEQQTQIDELKQEIEEIKNG